MSFQRDDLQLEVRELLGTHPELLITGLPIVHQFLARTHLVPFLLIEGYGIPQEYDHAQVALFQQADQTFIERCTVTTLHNNTGLELQMRRLSLGRLGHACKATIAFLERRGFFSLPETVGEEALDRPSVAIFANKGDQAHLVHFYFMGRWTPFSAFTSTARFWLTASALRLRIRSFFSL